MAGDRWLRRRRAVGALGAALIALSLTAGCGVRLQDEAEPLPSEALPSAAPTPAETQQAREIPIYFVNGRMLEAVPESLGSTSADDILLALAAGPPDGVDPALRTLILDPLTGAPVLIVTRATPGGQVVLRHTDAYLQVPPTYQGLLMGQVVSSLDSAGYGPVLLTDPAGQAVAVSLPDGRVRENGLVTAEDYKVLVS